MTITFRVKVLSFCCSVAVEEGWPWGYLATLAFKLFTLSAGSSWNRLRMKEIRLEGHGSQYLDFGEKIDKRLSGHNLILVLEGSFSSVISSDRGILLTILAFLSPSPRDIAILIQLDQKMSRVLESDEYWGMTLKANNTKLWEGVGRDGTAMDEWLRYGRYFGLPLKNVLRIRHLNHTTSRLRLYYGTLNSSSTSHSFNQMCSPPIPLDIVNPKQLITNCITAIDVPDVPPPPPVSTSRTLASTSSSRHRGQHHLRTQSSAFGVFSDAFESVVSTPGCSFLDNSQSPSNPPIIFIIGCNHNPNASRSILRRLMLSLPMSALFPTSPPPYIPLCKEVGGFLMNIEASPLANLRQFKNKKDPGILVEGVSQQTFYQCQETVELRRIGDHRLSLVEFSHDLGGSRHINELIASGILEESARAYIFVIDGKVGEDIIHSTLEDFLNTYILGPFLMKRQSNAHSRSRSLTLPLQNIPLVKLHDRPFVVFVGMNSHYITEHAEINIICQRIRRVTENILRSHPYSTLLRTSKLKWFIQPYDELADEPCLNNGVGAGINWLTRALNASAASARSP